ncbi:MAG: sugar transferase, partial [Anaerococcus sp.]|nr:sugar transferase [Anaerococcus sp.]
VEKKRLSIRPGVTGYSQAYYRNSISQAEKLEKDVYYAENLNFIFDVKIIIQTVKSVLLQKNINTN